MLRHAALLTIAAMLSGCFVDLLGATAVTSTLQKQQLETGQRAIQHATNTTGRINLEQAIAAYRADTGQYPETLEAMTPGYIREIPLQADGQPYGYDPATGRLFDSPGQAANAAGPTAADHQKMQQIRQAINAYGHATGYYPPTLAALTPNYLAAVPHTDSGQPFAYNNQNGDLRHPNAGQLPHRGGSGGGSAAGPMGEALTGIGVQNQLQNMNQSGANAAGSRARENINQQRGSQNERQQNNLLEDLGV